MAERLSSSHSPYYQSPGSSGSSDNDSNSAPEDPRQQPANIFRNDGSFMEMFKRMQEQQQEQNPNMDIKDESKSEDVLASSSTYQDEEESLSKEQSQLPSSKKPAISLVGKRRGGRILATGMVKKQRKEPQKEKKPPEGSKTDAWSEYMNEVRKYREQSCEEEGKRRPLVK
ncbi:hypothetical protein SK128_008515 [Halocaridina rubra]|uniref:Telomerase RNA component interacting RNase n=1 Tax=Halocaridina rubra TaxID=373956 RepID=A0AAN8X717_HALRR